MYLGIIFHSRVQNCIMYVHTSNATCRIVPMNPQGGPYKLTAQ
jgi:hypothetical protein